MDLKEAICILIKKEHIEDFIYDVRNRAVETDLAYKGNSWEHPRVKQYSEAINVLKKYLE